MPFRFEIDKETMTVNVRPTDLIHREFNAIWEADKAKGRRTAQQHFIFLYCFCDVESDYFDSDHAEKLSQCKDNAYGDPDHKWDARWLPLMEAALAKYELLNSTAPRRALNTIDRKIDQFRVVLDSTVPIISKEVRTELDKNGKAVSKTEIEPNIELVLKTASGITKLQQERETIEAIIAKRPKDTKNRADKAESLLEQGRLGPKPNKS